VSSCQIGGQLVEGRRRPSGKRSSPSLRPELYAPAPSRNFLRREAERNFVERLSIAWARVRARNRPAQRAALTPVAVLALLLGSLKNACV
jgi:hypothetical protein